MTTDLIGCGNDGHIGFYHGGCIPCCKLNALAAECARLRGVVREAAERGFDSVFDYLEMRREYVATDASKRARINAILAELGVGEESPLEDAE